MRTGRMTERERFEKYCDNCKKDKRREYDRKKWNKLMEEGIKPKRPIITCSLCKKKKRHHAKGKCFTCYDLSLNQNPSKKG